MDAATAYALCQRDARGHYENFPVASLLMPRAMRPHVAAVYAFARTADDFADEGTRSPAERLRLLDGWRDRLRAAAEGGGPGEAPAPGEPAHAQAIFVALGESMRRVPLPVGLLEDLLSAFSQDVRVHRYENWDDLLDYCRRSANPVGRLVLRIAGHDDPWLDDWSDAICTALQLTNFWQDARVDFDRGRIYLPAETRAAHGAGEHDLASGVSPAWRRALGDAAARTRALFDVGRPLCGALRGRLRLEITATWLGGVRILDRLAAVDYDVVGARPTLGVRDAAWIATRMLA